MNKKYFIIFGLLIVLFSASILFIDGSDERLYTGLVIGTNVTYPEQPLLMNYEKSDYCDGKKLSSLKEFSFYGASMQPRIYSSNKALVASYNGRGKIVEGDIVVFNKDDKLVAHQVVGVYPDYVWTAALNQRLYDEDVVSIDGRIAYDDIEYVICGVVFT